MPSIRAKLTIAYAAALLGTTVVFSLAVYAALKTRADSDLAQRAATNGDLALRIIERSGIAGSTLRIVSDTVASFELSSRVRALLDVVPGFIIVRQLGTTPYPPIYRSSAASQLPSTATDAMIAEAADNDEPGQAVKLKFPRTPRDSAPDLHVVQVVRRGTDPAGVQWEVISVVSADDVPRREPFGAVIVIAPIILLISLGGAYFIAGHTFRPIDAIINEMEAITDGRSLHRRLHGEGTGDELARLVTTLNAMIGRLETSFGGLRRFTADASHELKTPLAVLRADVERAMHSPGANTEQLVALEEALQEITRMTDLVDSLLTLARADEGRFDLHRELIDLELLARDVLETAMILGEEAGINVSMPIVEPARVMGDQTRLRHLFLNLITNAIKYTPRGGKVELMLIRSPDTASFAVRDTGIGISAADLPHVFERFWRADRARSRGAERGGFGLGLAISQWVAQAHGGTLTVQSRLTRGSTFTVTLPLAPDGADQPAEAPGVTEQPAESTAPAATGSAG